ALSALSCLCVVVRRSSTSPLFPYTTLFRSEIGLSRSHWRDISVFAWPLIVSRGLTWVSTQFPRFILALNLTVAEMGLFSLASRRSEEHTSELQSGSELVCRLPLQKKNIARN